MKKQEFLKMMFQDNETESEPIKSAHEDIIECMYLALSQSPDNIEIDSAKSAKEACELIVEKLKEKAEVYTNPQDRKKICVGPFEAAELIAEYLGTKYERPSKLFASVKPKVNLDDFFD